MNEIEILLQLLNERKWVGAAAVLIWAIVRLLKMPSCPWPFSRIPSKARPLVAIVLGIMAGSLDLIVNGTSWQRALINGVLSSAVAVFGHEVFVEWLSKGKEPFAEKSVPPAALLAIVFVSGMMFGGCGYGKPACTVIDVLHQNCVWIQYLENGQEKRVQVTREELSELGRKASMRQQTEASTVSDAGAP